MAKYFKYLCYLIRHKWFVAVECWKHHLYWQAIVHDLSKFLPDEFIPYANYFYGKKKQIRDETGYYKPTDTGDLAFDFAWLLHQKRNPHHWQWWILPEDEGGVKILEMKYPYNLEMICDWVGAGKAQGYFSPPFAPLLETQWWYLKNKGKMQLHPKTREFVEDFLGP